MRETGVYTRLFVGLVSPLAFLRLNPPLMALLGLVFCFLFCFCGEMIFYGGGCTVVRNRLGIPLLCKVERKFSNSAAVCTVVRTLRLPKVVEWGRMFRDHFRIDLPSSMQARRVNGWDGLSRLLRTALSAPLHEPSSVNRVACTVPQGMPSQGTLPGLPMRPMSLPPPGMPPHSSQHPRPPLSMLRLLHALLCCRRLDLR